MSLVGGGAHLDFRTRKGLTPLHKAVLAGNTEAVKVYSLYDTFTENEMNFKLCQIVFYIYSYITRIIYNYEYVNISCLVFILNTNK